MKKNWQILILLGMGLVVVAAFFTFREHFDKQTQGIKLDQSVNAPSSGKSPLFRASDTEANISAAQNNVSSIQLSGLVSTPLTEYANAKSLKEFFDKYKDASPSSTERYLAEFALQRCAFVGLIGPERYSQSKLSKFDTGQFSDSDIRSYRIAIDTFVMRCKDFHGTVTSDQLKESNTKLQQLPAAEAQADQLAERIRTSGLNGFRAEADKLLINNNLIVIAGLASAWDEAIRKDPGKFSGTLFASIEPDIAAAAWRLAACEFGWDCGKSNEIVVEACLAAVQCNTQSLTDLYQKYSFSPEKYSQITRVRDGIVLAIRTSNFDQLRK